jgi:hypothetical protein
MMVAPHAGLMMLASVSVAMVARRKAAGDEGDHGAVCARRGAVKVRAGGTENRIAVAHVQFQADLAEIAVDVQYRGTRGVGRDGRDFVVAGKTDVEVDGIAGLQRASEQHRENQNR